MASATSSPPAPMASMPIEPAAGVWLSEPSKDFPGLPKSFLVDRMAYAVSRAAEPNSETAGMAD